jgi:putative transposase
MSISKTAYYHKPKKKAGDDEIASYLKSLAEAHKRWGFDKMMLKAKFDEKPWNHKRAYRIYCELRLNIRVKPRKRIPKGAAQALLQPIRSNVCWSADFMSDALNCGRRFRTFNVIDDYNRECLVIKIGFATPSIKVTQWLDQVASIKGYPDMIRVDNGPEFTSGTFKKWAEKNHVLIHYIQPGKPAQNGYIERFNRTYRGDVLDMNLFGHLHEVRNITREWLAAYNQDRPHESLNGLAPTKFAVMRDKFLTTANEGNSTFN